MGKFGISEEKIKKWRDNPILMEGDNGICFILIYGWSAMPRQMKDFAKILNQQGYWIYVPKLKGHGTRPEDLENAEAEDWIRDVERAYDEMKNNPRIKKICALGNSMGGSLSVILSLKRKTEGIVLLGTPVHLKYQFIISFIARSASWFNLYCRKTYPKNIKKDYPGSTSYQYFPLKSVVECLKIIKEAAYGMDKVTAPVLILQTNQDYMVPKYAPWIIYNRIRSKIKEIHFIESKYENHTMTDEEIEGAAVRINNFLRKIFKAKR